VRRGPVAAAPAAVTAPRRYNKTPFDEMACGDVRKWRRGCRCAACRRARSVDAKAGRLRELQGRPLLVDAGPAQARVRALRERGMSFGEIGYRANVRGDTLRQMLKSRTTHADIARAVLSIDPRTPPAELHGPRTDAVGTARRLQGMRRAGWMTTSIATEAGLRENSLKNFATVKSLYVSRVLADALAAATGRLAGVSPLDRQSRSRTSLARGAAVRRDWLPLWVWADIDDPKAQPRFDAWSFTVEVVDGTYWAALCGDSPDDVMRRHGLLWREIERHHRTAGVPVPEVYRR
jgi:lambda repressor-like predicted transcriptional regulator